MLAVVLPKGSLEKQVLDLFEAADLTVVRGGDRDYHAQVDDPRIGKVRFLRPQEIPTYVEQGIFDLGIRTMVLLSNNPAKRAGLEGYGLEIVGRQALPTLATPENLRYLRTKRDRMGHDLPGLAAFEDEATEGSTDDVLEAT